MHTYFIRPGGVGCDVPLNWLNDLYFMLLNFETRITEIYDMLKYNRIFQSRTKDVGIITHDMLKDLGFSGVMVRGSGIPYDLRKDKPYELYSKMPFKIAVGHNGDCFDRFLVRTTEIKTSYDIILSALAELPKGYVRSEIMLNERSISKQNMELLIKHFKHHTEGFSLPKESNYTAVEVPKGELGIFT